MDLMQNPGRFMIDHAVGDPDVAYHVDRGADLTDDEAIGLIMDGLDPWSHDRIAFGFGSLRRTRSAAGLALMISTPSLTAIEPEVTGKYLRSVAEKATPDELVALAERVAGSSDKQHHAERIRIAHGLAAVPLPASGAAALADVLAVEPSSVSRAHLAAAVCRSRLKNAWSTTLDVALDRPGLDLHRVVVATAPHPERISKQHRAALDALARRHPDSKPFVAARR